MAKAGIYICDVNCCTLVITGRQGLEDIGGMVRVDQVHYNTVEEINKL